MEMDGSELLYALRGQNEPESHVLRRLIQNQVSLNISILGEALEIAVRKGLLNSVRILLEAGASPKNKSEMHEETPLHVSSRYKQSTEIVRELIKYGADVNAVDCSDQTPLHYASKRQCFENMQELLKNGAMVDAVDGKRNTPLHLTVKSLNMFTSSQKSIEVLLKAGADVNLRDHLGYTPLHYAVVEQLPRVVRLLLQHKADANARNNWGETPMHKIVVDMYQSHETIRELLKGGARLNELNNKGHSPLFYAIIGHNEVATEGLPSFRAAFNVVRYLRTVNRLSSAPVPKIIPNAQELIRYALINSFDSLESIRQQLNQEKFVSILRKLSTPECNLEKFKQACLTEVEALSNKSCDCGKSSIWGSINNCEECECDTHQAILKFLFSVRHSNFMDAFFHKLSEEFLLEVTLNLISYSVFKESEKRLFLPWPCMKEIERYVSFEDLMSFLQSKQSEFGASEFEKFLSFIERGMAVESASQMDLPAPKRLCVS